MATNIKDPNHENNIEITSAENMSFGIVVSEWNSKVTGNLLKGAEDTLIKYGAKPENIVVKYVPGSFELTLGANFFTQYTDVDAVIVLGCVIQGETKHFDYVCQSVTQGITALNLKAELPVIFGVLTTNTLEQAEDRAGGKHGNKGEECAIAAIKMVALQNHFIDNAELDDYISDFWDDEDIDEDENEFDEDEEEVNEFEDDYDDDK